MPRHKKEHRIVGPLRVAAVSLGLFVLGVAGVLSLSLVWYPWRAQARTYGLLRSTGRYALTQTDDLKMLRNPQISIRQNGFGTSTRSSGAPVSADDRVLTATHQFLKQDRMPPSRPWSLAYQIRNVGLEDPDAGAPLTERERERIAWEAFGRAGRQGFSGVQVALPSWLVGSTMPSASHLPSGTAAASWVWIQPGQWFKQNWMWHGAALLAGLGLSALAWYKPWVIARRRIARGACAGCGYDLRDTPAGGPCPECGKEAVVLSA